MKVGRGGRAATLFYIQAVPGENLHAKPLLGQKRGGNRASFKRYTCKEKKGSKNAKIETLESR
jgi:hypothetical protein